MTDEVEKDLDDFSTLQKALFKCLAQLAVCLSIVIAIHVRIDIMASNSEYRAEVYHVVHSYFTQVYGNQFSSFIFDDEEIPVYGRNDTPPTTIYVRVSLWFLLTIDKSNRTTSSCRKLFKQDVVTNFDDILDPENCLKQNENVSNTNTDKFELNESSKCEQKFAKLANRTQTVHDNLVSTILRYVFFDSSGYLPIAESSNQTEYATYISLESWRMYECLIAHLDYDTIHLEVTLYNTQLDQLVHVHISKWPDKPDELELRVIELKRSFFHYEDSLVDFVPAAVLIFAFFFHIVSITRRIISIRTTSYGKLFVEINIFYFLARLFYFEILIRLEMIGLEKIFADEFRSLRYLSDLDWSKDLTMGLLSSLACIRALPYVRFNEITSQVLITFDRCKWDMVGFFVVFIGLFLGYAFVLEHMLGGHMREFSNLLYSIASLLSFYWGELDLETMLELDWKSLVILVSYFIVMIIFMFNLMLAIILGTYDRVRADPGCQNLHLKINNYFYKIIDKFINKSTPNESDSKELVEKKSIIQKIKDFVYFKARKPTYFICDFENELLKNGFRSDTIKKLLTLEGLRPIDQVNRWDIDKLVEKLVELECEEDMNAQLQMANGHFTESDLKSLISRFKRLEKFSEIIQEKTQSIIN